MERLEHELNELRKEIVEARNMNIKTETTLRGLFAELKKVSANQQNAQKRARLHTVATYVIFVLVIGAAAFYLNRMMTANLQQEIERQGQALNTAGNQVRELRLILEGHSAAEKRVTFLLKLVKEGKKEEAVEEYRKIDQIKFSEAEQLVLKEKFEIILAELAKKHYDAGMNQWRIGGHKSAVMEFNLSQSYKSDTDYMPSLLFYRGLSMYESKRFDEAAESLKNALAAGLSKLDIDTARLKCADAYIKGGRFEEAIKFIEGLPLEQMTTWNRQNVQMKMTQAKEGLLRKQSMLEADDKSEMHPVEKGAEAAKNKGKAKDPKTEKPR